MEGTKPNKTGLFTRFQGRNKNNQTNKKAVSSANRLILYQVYLQYRPQTSDTN